MPIAAHLAIVSVATGASVAHLTFDGCNSFDLSDGTDLLDTTDFASGRIRQRIAALRDISGSLDLDLELTDPAFLACRASYNAGTAVHFRILADGTNGLQIPALISSIDRSGSVDGKVTVSISWETEGSYDPAGHPTPASGM